MTLRWLNLTTRREESPDSVGRLPESVEKPRGGHWNWSRRVASVGWAGPFGPAQVPATAPLDPSGFLAASHQDGMASLSAARFQSELS